MGLFDKFDQLWSKEEIACREKMFLKILENKELYEQLGYICCMEFLEKLEPLSNIADSYKFNMDGQIFATDWGGGYYIFLEDGTIGYVNFREDECGRAAESLKEMLELELNCAYSWHNYADKKYVEDIEVLRKSIKGYEVLGREQYDDAFGEEVPEYDELQKIVAEALELNITKNIVEDILVPFYKTTTRQPEFIAEIPGDSKLGSLIH